MEKIKEVFAEEEKARNIHRLQVRAKRRQEQAEKLKKSVQSTLSLVQNHKTVFFFNLSVYTLKF